MEQVKENLAGRMSVLPARETPEQNFASERERVVHPIVALTAARVREFLREPESVFWVIFFPVLLSLALGIAFRSTPPEKSRVAIDTTNPQAQQIADALSKSPDVEVVMMSPAEAATALRTGNVAVVVTGAAQTTNDATTATAASPVSAVTFRYDPTRSASRTARFVADDALQKALGRRDVAQVHDLIVTEKGARLIDFLIPGLIGLNLMSSSIYGMGFAIVSARTRKLMKRLAATPMRRSHYLLSFVLSRMVFITLQVLAIYGFAHLIFGVEMRGSYLAFIAFLALGALTFAGIGILIAARPQTTEGVSGMMNLVMLPMWLLSGTFFPTTRFPQFIQPFIRFLPLTALNDGLRAVMNGTATLTNTWAFVSLLLIWAAASFVCAVKIFRWQ